MKTLDLYSEIAQAEGVDRNVVKTLAMPFLYSMFGPELDLKESITKAVRMHKSFLKMEESDGKGT